MSKKEDRRNKIISIIKENNGASVKELATKLDVSDMTIRRDIRILEEQNIVETFHGAIVYNSKIDNPINEDKYSLDSHLLIKDREKFLIGQKAASMIKEDDIIIIDTGTTTEKLSQAMDDIKCTALVFSSNNLINLLFKKNIDLIIGGGNLHRDSGMMESNQSIEMMKNIRASKLFLSAAGVHKDLGITCENSYELNSKKIIIRNSLEVILLADSSKFGAVKSTHFADLSEIDTIISDKNLSDEWQDYLKEMDIKLILV
ncbi:DeoR/GlpR transcriptional regulator [Anaerococcus sp. AGMB00486]|uniref:DeoR/GlpR transcriptional regulator n=2 Tax=Anaerococcus TaxID=165779 RepID=A0ABX2NC83_9FIRM|nr:MULTISPECIES: DeoR/GlpR family DNA-binding transcription regulator [Anaerococcus]MSS77953.1 DeoR/GlpR transcriptional regulator [Anaerococcus porci]NVF12293.1 DeoR/GlpR transcriptional regulator [Anaerococcus faecalis]